MARPKSVTPGYLRHSSGQARVVINGRDILLGTYNSAASKRAYARIIAEYAANGSVSSGGANATRTVRELLAAFTVHARQYYGTKRSSEWTNHLKRIVKQLKDTYADLPAADFGPEQFKAIRHKLIKAGSSRTYINATMKRVTRIFRWGAAEGLIPVAVAQTLSLIPGLRYGRSEAKETAPIKPVEQDRVDATLPHLRPIVADMVRLQLLTGCRPAEVCKIKPSMVDRSSEVWRVELAEHKTAHHGKKRTLYIGPEAQKILCKYLLRGADEFCFSPEESEQKRRAEVHETRVTSLSCGNRPGHRLEETPIKKPGKCYTAVSYARSITRAAAKAKVDSWSPNQLRHLAATRLRKSYGIDAACTILGHSDLSTTQIYAERDEQRAIEIMRSVG